MSTKNEIINYLFKSQIFKYKETYNAVEECPYVFDISKSLIDIEKMKILVSYIKSVLKNNCEDVNLVIGIDTQCIPIAFQLSNEMKLSMASITSMSYNLIGSIISIGDEAIIILDVLVSKEKTLEILKYLEGKGIIISIILVILDNENGVIDEIKNNGYKVLSLLNIFSIIEVLSFNKSIEIFQYEKIGDYTNILKNEYIKRLTLEPEIKTDENTDEFPLIFSHKLRSVILSLMSEKETALCLSLDVPTWEEAKTIINICGSKICMIITHFEMYNDIISTTEFSKSVLELARIHKFLILEDTQISSIKSHIAFEIIKSKAQWSSFISINSYEKTSFNNTLQLLDYWLPQKESTNITSCLILETTSTTTSISKEITDKTLEKYNYIVPILITQSAPHIKNFLKLTPGIKLEKHVPTGSKFRSIENAIVDEENHIVIMGNGIYKNYSSDEILQNVIEYSAESWRCFKMSNENIVSKIQLFQNEYTRIQTILLSNYEKADIERKNIEKVKKDITNKKKESGTWNLRRLAGMFRTHRNTIPSRESIII